MAFGCMIVAMSDTGVGESVDTRQDQEVQRPRQYKVLIHNDDYTTMEFVVYILQSVFGKPTAEAVEIMLNVHKRGTGVAGVYPAAIAETKISTVHRMASDEGFPLRCSMEPE